MKKLPFYQQLSARDCGPTCLRMVAKFYGRHFSTEGLRAMAGVGKEGVSLLGISDTAEKIGFRTRGVRLDISQLGGVDLPAIVHWDSSHFVVLYKISKRGCVIADPSQNAVKTLTADEFQSHWYPKGSFSEKKGVLLLLEPTPAFFEQPGEKEAKLSWAFLFKYTVGTRARIFKVLLSFLLTSFITFLLPFITQGIVDYGINAHDFNYLTIALIAQVALVVSQNLVGFIRSRILLSVSNLFNLRLLSDFIAKLTRLPLIFFDTRLTGDIIQRLYDNRVLQSFITGNTLNTVYSVVTFLIYSFILTFYNSQLFIIFLVLNSIYAFWVTLFLRYRRKINYQTFGLVAAENEASIQMIQGMQEIRMNNAERTTRWAWEGIQIRIFKLGIKTLNLTQIQSFGAVLIGQIQNIVITFVVAKKVIEGQMTMGMMLAVQYIVGQLSEPIMQWVGFLQSYQDAKISLERLNEVHEIEDEEPANRTLIKKLPKSSSIIVSNLYYGYPGAISGYVLQDVNLEIKEKKITAIVGQSGSGKTTLLKILLKIFQDYEGQIKLGNSEENSGINFNLISPAYWRSQCGVVLQNGFLFNDTIASNIALGQEFIDLDRVKECARIANIEVFIESLPSGFYTKIGHEGAGLSQGQKQRILIARALYKNPNFIFFDEATNSLDAKNEFTILENLKDCFDGKTVVVVAHRLSTIKNADKIVVLDQGRIIEEGTHHELIEKRGKYFELVKSQVDIL